MAQVKIMSRVPYPGFHKYVIITPRLKRTKRIEISLLFFATHTRDENLFLNLVIVRAESGINETPRKDTKRSAVCSNTQNSFALSRSFHRHSILFTCYHVLSSKQMPAELNARQNRHGIRNDAKSFRGAEKGRYLGGWGKQVLRRYLGQT